MPISAKNQPFTSFKMLVMVSKYSIGRPPMALLVYGNNILNNKYYQSKTIIYKSVKDIIKNIEDIC